MLNIQKFDGSLGQRFKFSRVTTEETDIAFKITSREVPDAVIAINNDCTTICLVHDGLDLNNQWIIESSGTIQSVIKCNDKGFVLDITGASNEVGAAIMAKEKDEEWSQKWRVVSTDAVLLKASENDSTQIWSPRFVDPGYDLAVNPGFPGNWVSSNSKTCLDSTQDRDLAKAAMHSCDESMSLLVGSKVSIGRLKAISELIRDTDHDRMPGYCCMDVASNSQFFGYDVSDIAIRRYVGHLRTELQFSRIHFT